MRYRRAVPTSSGCSIHKLHLAEQNKAKPGSHVILWRDVRARINLHHCDVGPVWPNDVLHSKGVEREVGGAQPVNHTLQPADVERPVHSLLLNQGGRLRWWSCTRTGRQGCGPAP